MRCQEAEAAVSLIGRRALDAMRQGILSAAPLEPAALHLATCFLFFFAALFLAYGVIVPYFPVWLNAKGLAPFEISTIVAAPLFVRVFFTPALGLLADRHENKRRDKDALAWSGLALVLIVSQLS